MSALKKRDIMHRHLFENRDRKVNFKTLLAETGISRKEALEILPQLHATGFINRKCSGGATYWYWQPPASLLTDFMRSAKNRCPLQHPEIDFQYGRSSYAVTLHEIEHFNSEQGTALKRFFKQAANRFHVIGGQHGNVG